MNSSLSRFRRLIPSSMRSPLRPLRQLSLPANVGGEEEEEEAPPEPIDQRRLPADYDPATFDPAEHRSPPTSRVFRLVDEVASLTLSEVSELSAILVRKLGMEGPPRVAVMKPGAAAFAGGTTAAAPKEEKVEKTVFELKLDSFDAASKLKVIKEVRALTELGLKEAKELVEKAPAVFKAGVSKEEGEAIVDKLKAVGAKVSMV